MGSRAWCGILLAVAVGPALAAEFPLRPYTDPEQLQVPWPKHSHYRQPWRAFLETRSGAEFAGGIGINFNVPENEDLAARLLAEAGFTAARIEIGWGQVRWDESGFRDPERIRRRLDACRAHGLRPTILLNAHHGVPCPVRFEERRVTAGAPKGSRTVRLDSVAGSEPGRCGLSNLTEYVAAQVFVTAVDTATGECALSAPLPRDLAAEEKILLATLKYLPAHPVGTPEFEETASGWERYTGLVLETLRTAAIEDFDIEIWNELSFGSRFLGTHGINQYYEPPKARFGTDFLNPGGHAWEIGRRTVELVTRRAPRAACIWGFSNTTFFHTRVDRLPPGMGGQSYHPYGTGTRRMPEREQAPKEPWRCLEGFVPTHDIRMPEGWAHTFLQTESLMRLLHPEARRNRPEGSGDFRHCMTEHGVVPAECGIHDEAGCWDLKTRCALRSFCFWLNKGVAVLHYYCAYDGKPGGMGLLPCALPSLAVDAGFADVATPPLAALRRLTGAFARSVPVAAPVQLAVEEGTALTEGRKVFEGDGEHPPLWERELLAVLPFQVSPDRFVVAVYVMTYDITSPMPEMPWRLVLGNVPEGVVLHRLYDPLQDREVPVRGLPGAAPGRLGIELPVADTPRLLELERPPVP
ncbi:MAG: hypothetical protein JXR77_02500 [Lentisphaeria bacterium]|nr:hypothetical protein [Lentisphaeria bacterium]